MSADPSMPPPLSVKEARLQRILKVVVVVLGIAILVVLGIIVMAIVGGGRDRGADSGAPGELAEAPLAAPLTAPGAIPAPPGSTAAFGQRELPLPAGAVVSDMIMGDGLLVVHYRTEAGGAGIAIVDLRSGAVRGHLEIVSGE